MDLFKFHSCNPFENEFNKFNEMKENANQEEIKKK